MSRYNEPQVLELARQHNGRKRRALRIIKRAEAEARDALTLPHKRRDYWRELAAVVPFGDDLDVEPGPCKWPHKTAYENSAVIAAARRGMAKHRKGQGLHPYWCRAGHWHLGRNLRRSTVAWRAVA